MEQKKLNKEKSEIKYSPMVIGSYPQKKDVVGQSRVFIEEFIDSVDSEELYRNMGVKPDKSFLIVGPPGNGKTLCIEALVNEVNKDLYKYENIEENIKLIGFKYDIGRYGTAYINEGSKIIQGFFDVCLGTASKGYKTLAIFDEADNLFGKRRGDTSHKEDSKVLETIMKNLQIIHDTKNIYVVMMSNFEDAFDEASIRAGRIDRRYVFKKPTIEERKFAYRHSIEKINEEAGYCVVRKFNTDDLSRITDGFSYTDVYESVNSAVKQKAKEVHKKSPNKKIPYEYITQSRLEKAVIDHKEHFVKKNKEFGFL